MIVRGARFPRTKRALAGLTDGVFPSLGTTFWEWLHPDEVRAEAEAVGYTGPIVDVTFGDVVGAAMEDTRDVVAGGAEEIASGAQSVVGGAGKLGLGLAAVAAIAAVIYFTKGRK